MRQRKEVILKVKEREVSEYEDMCLFWRGVPFEVLLQMVLDSTGWDRESIFSKSRKDEKVFRRGILDLIATSNGVTIYQCAKETGRDHTTVIHSLRSIENRLDTDFHARNVLREILSYLRENKEFYQKPKSVNEGSM